jgi:predicted RNA binding protein YcfA (HicA-like mRNA interferase family)
MPSFRNTKRKVVLRVLTEYGFQLITNQGRHGCHLVRNNLSIPFPSYDVFAVNLLKSILEQAGITRQEWLDS